MDGSVEVATYEAAPARAPARRVGPGTEFWRTAALTVAPIMIFAVAAMILLAFRDNDLRAAALTRTATAFTIEIDRAFAAQAAGLTALSASDSLDHDDFAAFHREASRVVALQPEWVAVILSDPASGQQLVNTVRPLGAPLPVIANLEAQRRAVAEKRPVFVSRPHGNGQTTGLPVYGMHVPALREGEVKYVLSATFTPAAIVDLLKRTRVPADVHGLIVNEGGHLLARIAEGGAVTLTTGNEAAILPPEIFESEDAAAVAPMSGWSVHLKRGVWSELQFAAQRLWLLAAAGVISMAVGLFSLFIFIEQRKRAEETLETRVAARTSELAAASEQKDILVEELHHRVNNNLQIVGSLVRVQERGMNARGEDGATEPLKLLRERLGSLFMVHREMAGPMPTVEIGSTLKKIAEAALGREGAAQWRGESTTVRRDPALIAGFALCEFLRSPQGAGEDTAGAVAEIALERQADTVHVTAVHRAENDSPPLTKDREELILLLADQGRGTARIEYAGAERRLFLQVHAAI